MNETDPLNSDAYKPRGYHGADFPSGSGTLDGGYRSSASGDDHAVESAQVDLEGEFTAVDEVAATYGSGDYRKTDADGLDTFGDDPKPSIPPQLDPVLVASVDRNRLAVKPGTSVSLRVMLLNNGRRPAQFRLRLEGWIHSAWVTMPRIPPSLEPGQRAELTLTISPPRTYTSTAGRHEVLLSVQSPEYPERQTRLPILLAIAPYDELLVSDLQPRRLQASWGRRTTSATTTIQNAGNRSAKVRVSGQCADVRCRFAFAASTTTSAADDLMLTLEPGQTENLAVTVYPQHMPLVGFQDRVSPLRLVVSLVGIPQVPRVGSGRLRRRPLIGPPQMVVGLMLATMALVAMAVLGAVGFGLTHLIASTRSLRPVQAPAVPVVVVVPVNEPVPSTPPVAASDAATTGPGLLVTPMDTVRDGNVPLVRADQVTGPGGGPVASGGPVAGNGSDMTYAQLFREIGTRYNLDWRMLAAQAYVESRFDTVAIGKDGDLGLMQILPVTWAEWSGVVDVSDPFDAYSNVLVAAAYLDYLRSLMAQRGYTDVRWVLAAYNGGPDKVLIHIDADRGWDELDPALRQYAVDVLGIAATIPLE